MCLIHVLRRGQMCHFFVRVTIIIALCDEVLRVANGTIVFSDDDESAPPYSPGTMATYVCNRGYSLSGGDETRTCVDNVDVIGGEFNGTAPTCELTVIDEGIYYYTC